MPIKKICNKTIAELLLKQRQLLKQLRLLRQKSKDRLLVKTSGQRTPVRSSSVKVSWNGVIRT